MSTGIFDVTKYGVLGDAKTNNTKAIKAVVEQAEKNGGGTIYFPPGEYVTGSIEIKSNMTLYLESGAVILASENPNDYPIVDDTVIKGWRNITHSGIVKAYNCENISIRGRGKIDGRGQNWWHDTGEHRPRTLQLISCRNILIEGITIVNSPMWTVHPICSDNVTITGITIKNPANSPNTDGINPEGCSNVHISNCHIDVGDDCITLKSGTQDDLFIKQHACENITITNCTMVNGHGGVVIGSEMSGGVKNVTISNCVFCGTDRGIRIKTRRFRGGVVEDIRINNLIMTDVFCPIVINGFYKCGCKEDELARASSLEKLPLVDSTPLFKNFYISNVTARNVVAAACYMYGIPESPIEGVTIDNFVVDMSKTATEPKEPAMTFHDSSMLGKGIKLTNVKDVTIKNLRISTRDDSAVSISNSEQISIDGIIVNDLNKSIPAIKLENTNDVYIACGRLAEKIEKVVEQTNCSGVTVK